MNAHDIIDIPIFVLLTLTCIFVFMLQILFLNHILYDTYTTFVVGIQFNKYKIKNFINVYDTPQLKSIKLGLYWLKMHDSIFQVTQISRNTLYVTHKLSRTKFYVTVASKKFKKKCIQIEKNSNITITRDLLYIINTPNYYIISNRFAD